jgi:hypothetical protein
MNFDLRRNEKNTIYMDECVGIGLFYVRILWAAKS